MRVDSTSIEAEGSSRSKKSWGATSILARATRCVSPPERRDAFFFERWSRARDLSSLFAFALSVKMRCMGQGAVTFASTEVENAKLF